MATSTRARPKLTDFVVPKEAPELPLPEKVAGSEEEPAAAAPTLTVKLEGAHRRRRRGPEKGTALDGRIGQTLRLHPEAWEQLRILAARERVAAHDLLLEGVNLVFRARRVPEIA